jgi:dienelactone hydrolase
MANKTLEYRDGAVTLKGYLADDVRPGARPGVVLFPEAFGIGDHVIERARRLAALGYVALAADPYGDGVQAQDLPRAIELMTAVRSDVSRWRARAQAALDALCAQPRCGPHQGSPPSVTASAEARRSSSGGVAHR